MACGLERNSLRGTAGRRRYVAQNSAARRGDGAHLMTGDLLLGRLRPGGVPAALIDTPIHTREGPGSKPAAPITQKPRSGVVSAFRSGSRAPAGRASGKDLERNG